MFSKKRSISLLVTLIFVFTTFSTVFSSVMTTKALTYTTGDTSQVGITGAGTNFPAKYQGQNNWYVLWGTTVAGLSESNCYPSTDEGENPQQWKGPLTYATINETFMMPDSGVDALKYKVTQPGYYNINFTYNFSGGAGGNGTEMGVKINGVSKHSNVVNAAPSVSNGSYVNRQFLSVGDEILFYCDSINQNGGWDFITYSIGLTQEKSITAKEKFPADSQGQNDFEVFWGNNYANLSANGFAPSTDDPIGAQQWYNPSSGAVLSENFIMPGTGVTALRYTAPADGLYRANLAWEFGLDIATVGEVFNGFEVGLKTSDSSVYSYTFSKTGIQNDETNNLIYLRQGETITLYMDAISANNAWDLINYSLKIDFVTNKVNLNASFPANEQGENGWNVLWGTNIAGLSTANTFPSTYESDGDLQQWKGGSTYATFTKSFLMPGTGVMASEYSAPATGSYKLDLTWSHNGNIDETTDYFNGYQIGFAIDNSKQSYDTCQKGVKTNGTLTQIIDLVAGQKIQMFMDSIDGNDAWDNAFIDFTVECVSQNSTVSVPVTGDISHVGITGAGTGFPSKYQGQNNWYVLWGTTVAGLSESNCYPSIDEGANPQQWKGPLTYATINETFMMPDSGVDALKYKVTQPGYYKIDFNYNFAGSAGGNGTEMGVTINGVNKHSNVVNAAPSISGGNYVNRQYFNVGDEILFYCDSINQNGGWDFITYSIGLTQEKSITAKEKFPVDSQGQNGFEVLWGDNYADLSAAGFTASTDDAPGAQQWYNPSSGAVLSENFIMPGTGVTALRYVAPADGLYRADLTWKFGLDIATVAEGFNGFEVGIKANTTSVYSHTFSKTGVQGDDASRLIYLKKDETITLYVDAIGGNNAWDLMNYTLKINFIPNKLNLADSFPVNTQGENGWNILWGSRISSLSASNCTASTDESDGALQQWKGGSTYATLAKSFLMPGTGVMAVEYTVPVTGSYNLGIIWSHAGDPNTIGDASNGYQIGFSIDKSKQTYDTCQKGVKTNGAITQTVNLVAGQKVQMFMDSINGNDGWDIANIDFNVECLSQQLTGVTMEKTAVSLLEGVATQLETFVSDATYSTLNWTSSNNSVATVNQGGYVTPIANGTARITATTETGDYTAICDVTVTSPLTFKGYKLSQGLITQIQPGTSVNSFKSILNPATGVSLAITKNGSSISGATLVGTGTSVRMTAKGLTDTTYKALVYGDVGGDGDITVSDLVSVKKHLLKIDQLNDVYFAAADINQNSSITISDLLSVKKHVLGLISIGETFSNPISADGANADPFVTYVNGYYYGLCTYDGDLCSSVRVFKSARLQDLFKSTPISVFSVTQGTNYANSLWGPRLYFVDGRWYIYFSAKGAGDFKCNVLSGGTDENDPLNGSYSYTSELYVPEVGGAIDPSLITIGGQNYLLCTYIENETNHIAIATMTSPTTIASDTFSVISSPTYSWEKAGNPNGINEGAKALYKNGQIMIIYAASNGNNPGYCMGQLTLTNPNAPLSVDSWSKTATPVFEASSTVWGPACATFVKSPDGTEDWMVYHAKTDDGNNWNRNLRMQKFTWDGNNPNFGTPVDIDVAMPVPSGTHK